MFIILVVPEFNMSRSCLIEFSPGHHLMTITIFVYYKVVLFTYNMTKF